MEIMFLFVGHAVVRDQRLTSFLCVPLLLADVPQASWLLVCLVAPGLVDRFEDNGRRCKAPLRALPYDSRPFFEDDAQRPRHLLTKTIDLGCFLLHDRCGPAPLSSRLFLWLPSYLYAFCCFQPTLVLPGSKYYYVRCVDSRGSRTRLFLRVSD